MLHGLCMAPLLHQVQSDNRFQGADQHRVALPFRTGHRIKTVMHTVNQVHIGIPAVVVHDLRAFAPVPVRVAGFINGAHIGFCFYNHTAGYAVRCTVYQQAA